MKKTLAVLLVLTLLVPIVALAGGFGLGTMYVYTSNGKALNVRSTPDTGDNIIGHLNFGDACDVVGFYGDWAEIKWGDTTAYVQKRFLQWYEPKDKPQPQPTKDPDAGEKAKMQQELDSEVAIDPITLEVHATRASGRINLRQEPSKIAKRLDSFDDGVQLQANAETINWYRVIDPKNNQPGYIHKNYVTVVPQPEPVPVETVGDLGTVNVNGAFDLQCTIPDGYKLQIMSSQKTRILADLIPDDVQRPQMFLTVAFDDQYSGIEKMNDMSDEDIETLKQSFTTMNDIEFSEAQTGEGTKLLVAKEAGEDEDYVSIITVYKGYLIEFVLMPNPEAADQTLTDDQIQKSIDFLTNLQFVPAA